MKNISAKIEQRCKLVVICLIMLGASACSQNNFQANANSRAAGVTTNSVATCQAQSLNLIYNENSDGQNFTAKTFTERFRDFVSSTISPESLGDLTGEKNASAQTRVEFQLNLKFGADSKIIPAQSNIDISIVDSLVGQKDSNGDIFEAYPVSMSKALSGQIDRTQKTFTAVFQDDYGSITVTGSYDSAAMKGRIDFANTKFHSGDASQARSGVLGAFQVAACGLQ